MNIYEKRAAFKKKVMESEDMLTLVGAFDGITARLVQHVGFDGAYMGGQAAASSMRSRYRPCDRYRAGQARA